MKGKKFLILLAVMVVILLAWYLVSPLFGDKVVDESISTIKGGSDEISFTSEATFQDADKSHKTSGTVSLVEVEDERYIRFEDFETTNGPDLYVYLSKDLEASDFVDLGELKGNIGNQNHEIVGGVSIEDYPYVLIWCKAFSVLFGSAKFDVESSSIDDFESCIAAGNPAMESYPRQCRDPDSDRTFTEVIDDSWKLDDITLFQNEDDGSYGCFGCGGDPMLCIDPAFVMKQVSESEQRYCDSEFGVVEG